MTNCEKYGLNDCGVFTKHEVAVSYGTEYERSAVLVAQDDNGYWHYGLDQIDGGFKPSLAILRGMYNDKQLCIDAGRMHLLNCLQQSLKWHESLASSSSEGADEYGVRARLYKEHINHIMQQSLF